MWAPARPSHRVAAAAPAAPCGRAPRRRQRGRRAAAPRCCQQADAGGGRRAERCLQRRAWLSSGAAATLAALVVPPTAAAAGGESFCDWTQTLPCRLLHSSKGYTELPGYEAGALYRDIRFGEGDAPQPGDKVTADWAMYTCT